MTWKLASPPPARSLGAVPASSGLVCFLLSQPWLEVSSFQVPSSFHSYFVIYVPRIQTFPLTSQLPLDQSSTQANKRMDKPITPTRHLTLHPEGSGWANWQGVGVGGVRKDAKKALAEVKGGSGYCQDREVTMHSGQLQGPEPSHSSSVSKWRRAPHDSGVLLQVLLTGDCSSSLKYLSANYWPKGLCVGLACYKGGVTCGDIPLSDTESCALRYPSVLARDR